MAPRLRLSKANSRKSFSPTKEKKIYPGCHLVCLLLSTAAGVFEDFRYHREFLDGENAALEFSAHIGDVELKAVHLTASTPRANSWKSKSWCATAEGVKALGNAMAALIGPQVKALRAAPEQARRPERTRWFSRLHKKELLMKASSPALRHSHFPGESVEYRGARNALLAQEMELRRQIERVAAQRGRCQPAARSRGLRIRRRRRIGKTFRAVRVRKRTRWRFTVSCTGPKGSGRARMTHILDALDGETEHILQRINLAVVAKSPLPLLSTLRRNAAGTGCVCCLPPATAMTATISANLRVRRPTFA